MVVHACLSLRCLTLLPPQRGFSFCLASHESVKASENQF